MLPIDRPRIPEIDNPLLQMPLELGDPGAESCDRIGWRLRQETCTGRKNDGDQDGVTKHARDYIAGADGRPDACRPGLKPRPHVNQNSFG